MTRVLTDYLHPLGDRRIPDAVQSDRLRCAAHYCRKTASDYNITCDNGYGALVFRYDYEESSMVDRVNFNTVHEMLNAAGSEYVCVSGMGGMNHYGNWACLTFPLTGRWLAVAADVLDRLADYPVLDDEALCAAETDDLRESIALDLPREYADELSDTVVDLVMRWAFDEHSVSRYSDMPRGWLDMAREYLSGLGILSVDDAERFKVLDRIGVETSDDPCMGFGGAVLADAVRNLEDRAGLPIIGMLDAGLDGLDQTYWLKVRWSDLMNN